MALMAGNRTYYNPTHGIDWRGNLLPFNTFYAIMSLSLFFIVALILRLCYRHYRFEIRRAGAKQEEAKKKYETYMAHMGRIGNGVPPGILKNSGPQDLVKKMGDDVNATASGEGDGRGELRVQFSEELIESNCCDAQKVCKTEEEKKSGETVKDECGAEGREASHL